MYDEDLSKLTQWFKTNVLNTSKSNDHDEYDDAYSSNLTEQKTEEEQELSLIEFIIDVNDFDG